MMDLTPVPQPLGQFCGGDDRGHSRFSPGKPTPVGSPSEQEERPAYSFAKINNSVCNWGNVKQNRAFKSGSALPIWIPNELAIA